MGDIGKPCTQEEGCTLPNIYCAYPNCARGKARKEAAQLRSPTDTAFLEGVKAGLEASEMALRKKADTSRPIMENERYTWIRAASVVSLLDPTTIKPVTEE